MKIKHYRAPDMRQALRQVRDAQGPDAVILSSRKVNGGVEVVAAVDYDEEAVVEQGYGQSVESGRDHLTRAARDLSFRRGEEDHLSRAARDLCWTGGPNVAGAGTRESGGCRRGEEVGAGMRESGGYSRGDEAGAATRESGGYSRGEEAGAATRESGGYRRGEEASAGTRESGGGMREEAASDRSAHSGALTSSPSPRGEGWGEGSAHAARSARGQSDARRSAADYAALAKRLAHPNDFEAPDARSDVNEELRTLRRMLETQLATLAWNDLSRRSPVQTELLKELTVLGLAHDLAGELVAQLPAGLDLSEAHRLALAMIARRIETVEERWINAGGVVAMIGATGVGKTTLIAKLAARWVLRHGPRELALISTDSVRIGAQEQIHTLGRLLGAPAYAVDGAGELPALVEHLSERRLVLIDTAGLSQRDPRLNEELDLLASASNRLESTLVLSAAAQAGAIEESVERFSAARPASCVLTKLDEATSLGGVLSALIRFRLPLAYVSDGQRVPEDLNAARAHQLMARAVELSRKAGATADEDLLRRRFGAVAHAIA